MENDLAKQIRQLIEADKNGIVEITVTTFVRKWGQTVMKNLLKFSKENGFGYISILQGNKVAVVRLWKIKGKTLLEEPSELQN